MNKTKIVIFGFGAQGRSHALNLKESGFDVTVCIPEGSSRIADVLALGFKLVHDAKKAASIAEVAAFMVPDALQKNLYNEIAESLPNNSALVFAHGLSIHYKLIEPRNDLDVVLVAPLAHGSAVRQFYIDGKKVPVMIGIAQNVTSRAWQIAKDYARGLGSSDDKMIETTFKEETETDLFAEQALICGGLWRLITAAFETLVEEGYSPEIAYYSCLKETQILSEMFARLGIFKTFETISDTARFGALSRGPKIINDDVKKEMKKTVEEIKSGRFFSELQEEMQKGDKGETTAIMKNIAEHMLEAIHKKISKGD